MKNWVMGAIKTVSQWLCKSGATMISKVKSMISAIKKFLTDAYYEGNNFEESDDFRTKNFAIKGSLVEILIFYINIICLAILSFLIWEKEPIQWRYFVLLIPTLIWIFLRSSRKNMTATASWIAAIFGAIGGTVLVFLTKFLKINL